MAQTAAIGSLPDGRGVFVVVFDTEDQARQAASMFRIGEPPMQDAPEGVTVRSVSGTGSARLGMTSC